MSFLLGYASCCQPIGTPSSQECTCTAANVGVGLEHYVTGSTMPFEFRRTTLVGDPAGVQGPITNTITLSTSLADRGAGDETLIATPPKVNVAGVVSLFLKQLVAGVNITFDDITDDSLRINSPGVQTPVFQVDSAATILTDSDAFVTMTTLAGDAKVKDTEEWKINMCVLVCVPHGLGSTLTNAETKWDIETSTGVFAEFDRYSSRDQIAISGDQKSQPMHRTKKLTAQMDTPRMRVQVRRTTVGTADFFWEDPRWGGARIEAAP